VVVVVVVGVSPSHSAKWRGASAAVGVETAAPTWSPWMAGLVVVVVVVVVVVEVVVVVVVVVVVRVNP